MFSQVVSTLLRLTEEHADRWLEIGASHDVPIYGFERVIDPPPLDVNAHRLLDAFGKGLLTVADVWRDALAPETFGAVSRLAEDARDAAEAAGRADTPTTAEDSGFHFPDETWARVIYDMAVANHARVASVDKLVASLIPLYFGRVASLIVETKDLTTDQAEAFVERQARAFELAKPYLMSRWSDVSASVSVA